MPTPGPGMHCIVLVEPDAAIQALLAEALGSVGLRAIASPAHADPSLDALCAFLLQQQPAAVLIDIPPPYDLHWQRCCLLHRRLPQLPLLALTTDSAALDGLPENDGRVPILTKPFEITSLLQTVQQLVRRAPG